ncbi:hypothetical protein PHMEG_00010583 [Phytophthora megakarya]|uniref:Uncharacterized protein n=1 Tax=Phytophthora megakarya TaxID=4795 RepID=A0A225WDD0_9STRA|nr:hypothetical protein PHMEG_00010583 [Phytophthora megakarya]
MEVIPILEKLESTADEFERVDLLDFEAVDYLDEIEGDQVGAAEVYALEVYQEEIRRMEQIGLDQAVALSFYAKEEYKLLNPRANGLKTDDEDDVVVRTYRTLSCGHLYCKKCIKIRCRMGVRDRSMVPAHCCKREFPSDYVNEALDAVEFETYERFLKEKHWRSLDLQSDLEYAQIEFPSDYVKEALDAVEFETYERFLKDKPWRSLDLQSDLEYAQMVKQNHGVQCPGCGVGVQKISGCNHMQCLNSHEFCFLCTREWKTCGCPT